MNFLLKAFLVYRRKSEKGFAIPMVLSLGIIMVLLGTVSIFRSSEEDLTAITQRSTSRALNAAEAGVARYRQLLSNYKVIATYNACNSWSGTTCSASGSTWKNPTQLPNIDQSCPNNGSTVVANATTRAWQNIDDSDPSLGQYRLVDYIYDPNYDTATNTYTDQPTGTLIVEGRVNQNNAASAAVTRIRVVFPVQPGIPTPNGEEVTLESNFNSFNPALWLTGSTSGSVDASVTNIGDLVVEGNIIVTDSDCNVTGSLPNNNNLVIVDPRRPPLQPIPTGFIVKSVDAGNLVNNITQTLPCNDNSQGCFHDDPEIITESDGAKTFIYHYRVTGDLVLDNKEIKVSENKKVILYVDGNITLNGNAQLNPSPNTTSANLEIYGTNNTENINLKGNEEIKIKAFIQAPAAKVNISDNPKVDFDGSMFVKDWDVQSGVTKEIKITPDDQYFNYKSIKDLSSSSGRPRIVDPIIYKPSEWETVQVE